MWLLSCVVFLVTSLVLVAMERSSRYETLHVFQFLIEITMTYQDRLGTTAKKI